MTYRGKKRGRERKRDSIPDREYIRSDGILGVRLVETDRGPQALTYGDVRHWLPSDRERAAAWLVERAVFAREAGETLHDAAYRELFGVRWPRS
jgi:hypothetical protein